MGISERHPFTNNGGRCLRYSDDGNGQSKRHSFSKTTGSVSRLLSIACFNGCLSRNKCDCPKNSSKICGLKLSAKGFDKDFTKEESQGMMDLLYSDNPKDVAEFQWRLSQPLSVFIFHGF
jgi:hypothetical protein